MELFPTINVNAVQAEAIARGLYAVAAVDGVHERELALISELYRSALAGDESGGDGGAWAGGSVAALGRVAPLEPESLAPLLPGDELRRLFVKAAYLLAWADGSVSAAERAKIGQFARALAVPAESLAGLEAQVKEYLLRPLARLANVESVAAVARKLGA